MRSGGYNEKIDVLVPKLTINEFGEKIQDYELLFTTRAYCPTYSGSRYVVNEEVYNNYIRTFVIRAYHNINEKMLISYDNEWWRILSIVKDKQNQEIVIYSEKYNN